MNKLIADEFLRQITTPDEKAPHEPHVLIVRSDANVKHFITRALSEIEDLVPLIKERPVPWSHIDQTFTRIAELSGAFEQHNIEVVAHHVACAAAQLQAANADDETLSKLFGDFVTYVSTMLLRVYIEGSDAKCSWEVASVESLISQCQRRTVLGGRTTPAWLN